MSRSFFCLAVLLACVISSLSGAEADAPLKWVRPASFAADQPDLGLPVLKGAKHAILYAPIPSRADPAEGGSGKYESLRHGTYNHHQQFLVNGDKVIVYWTNHVRDENGPGQRLLAKVGTLAANGAEIVWGGDETLVELAPPAMPPRRRLADNNSELIDSAFLDGELTLVNGKMYLRGRLQACHGWTDDMRYHNSPLRLPVPDEHYRSGLDKRNGFRWDLYWLLGSFVQEVGFVEGKLSPTSPVYFLGTKVPEALQVTPGSKKKLAELNAPYRGAALLTEAPSEIQEVVAAANRGRAAWQGYPRYAKGMFKRAANGKDGLAHLTEFQRPDGQWVVVRDNLMDPEVYYAAVKATSTDTYPPAIRTNLFGTAMPVAGTLPDGSVWIVGGNRDRTDMFITLSRDGKTFAQTWSLLHQRAKVIEGISKPAYGGPQYYKALTLGQSIWIVYSIGKESLGITQIPFSALAEQK